MFIALGAVAQWSWALRLRDEIRSHKRSHVGGNKALVVIAAVALEMLPVATKAVSVTLQDPCKLATN